MQIGGLIGILGDGRVLGITSSKTPFSPCFLFAHSMGNVTREGCFQEWANGEGESLDTRYYVMKHGRGFFGLVLFVLEHDFKLISVNDFTKMSF